MRSKRARRTTMAALAGASLLAGPVAVACSEEPSYEEWAATDGAAGRINLDEIQEAFKKSDNPTDFRKARKRYLRGRRNRSDPSRPGRRPDELWKAGRTWTSPETIEDATDDRLFGDRQRPRRARDARIRRERLLP